MGNEGTNNVDMAKVKSSKPLTVTIRNPSTGKNKKIPSKGKYVDGPPIDQRKPKQIVKTAEQGNLKQNTVLLITNKENASSSMVSKVNPSDEQKF